jgi:hypothetical protein
MTKYDWSLIQLYHEQGHSVAECRRVFGFCKASWEHAASKGLVKYVPRPSPRETGEKYCAKCQQTLPLAAFSGKRDGWQSNCKECQAVLRHASYEKKKAYYRMKIHGRRRNILDWLEELKSGMSCLRCGFSHPAALQFHHRDPSSKEFEVTTAVRQGWARARILAEIAKCDCLCANCHFILHYEERKAGSSGKVNL